MNSLNEQIKYSLIIQKGATVTGKVFGSIEKTPYIFGDKNNKKGGKDNQLQKFKYKKLKN
jgi:hypothetical protein